MQRYLYIINLDHYPLLKIFNINDFMFIKFIKKHYKISFKLLFKILLSDTLNTIMQFCEINLCLKPILDIDIDMI